MNTLIIYRCYLVFLFKRLSYVMYTSLIGSCKDPTNVWRNTNVFLQIASLYNASLKWNFKRCIVYHFCTLKMFTWYASGICNWKFALISKSILRKLFYYGVENGILLTLVGSKLHMVYANFWTYFLYNTFLNIIFLFE